MGAIALVLVLLANIIFFGCGKDSITGPSPIPGASIIPASVTMGEGESVEFRLVDAPAGNYSWAVGGTKDVIEFDSTIVDGGFVFKITKVFRSGATIVLVATADGGRTRIEARITVR